MKAPLTAGDAKGFIAALTDGVQFPAKVLFSKEFVSQVNTALMYPDSYTSVHMAVHNLLGQHMLCARMLAVYPRLVKPLSGSLMPIPDPVAMKAINYASENKKRLLVSEPVLVLRNPGALSMVMDNPEYTALLAQRMEFNAEAQDILSEVQAEPWLIQLAEQKFLTAKSVTHAGLIHKLFSAHSEYLKILGLTLRHDPDWHHHKLVDVAVQ